MEITPFYQMLNEIRERINQCLVEHPETIKEIQILNDSLIEAMFKLQEPDINTMLDDIEKSQGANYDECKGY